MKDIMFLFSLSALIWFNIYSYIFARKYSQSSVKEDKPTFRKPNQLEEEYEDVIPGVTDFDKRITELRNDIDKEPITDLPGSVVTSYEEYNPSIYTDVDAGAEIITPDFEAEVSRRL